MIRAYRVQGSGVSEEGFVTAPGTETVDLATEMATE